MKRGKKVKLFFAGMFLVLSGLVMGCGVDVDVDENDPRYCREGYYYDSYHNACCPYDGCCGERCVPVCDHCK